MAGWLDQMELRLNSASVEVEVEVEAELGNLPLTQIGQNKHQNKKKQFSEHFNLKNVI